MIAAHSCEPQRSDSVPVGRIHVEVGTLKELCQHGLQPLPDGVVQGRAHCAVRDVQVHFPATLVQKRQSKRLLLILQGNSQGCATEAVPGVQIEFLPYRKKGSTIVKASISLITYFAINILIATVLPVSAAAISAVRPRRSRELTSIPGYCKSSSKISSCR